MALDKIVIGTRIRKMREEVFVESRYNFGKRCNLSERLIGQIERGEHLISLSALDAIASATGFELDYIIYGTGDNNKLHMRKSLNTILNRSDEEELKTYYKCISSIKSHINKLHSAK